MFRFDVPWRSDFAFAAGRYSVVAGAAAPVPVRRALLRPRPGIDAYLRSCAEVLGVLAREFGTYPYPAFAIVEVPPEQANAAGFQGASVEGFILVSSTYLDRAFELPYYAHELGHQWWGNLVKRGGTRGRSMLDEAEAQFREALARVKEPDLHGARFLLEYGLARVLFEKNWPEEARALLESAVRRPVRAPRTLPWVYFGFALLAKMSGDVERLRWAADAALTADEAAGGNTGAAEDVRALLVDVPKE